MSERLLFGEAEIAAKLESVARAIAAAPRRVDMAAAILTGAFVFAADLVRALAREGLDLPIEFLSLSRYGGAREGGDEIVVRVAPSTAVAGRHVLLIDGVLDHGHTLAKARTILREAGALSATIAVCVDKARDDALLKADYAAFRGVDAFIVGYGMDDAGTRRGLPYIASVE